MSNRSILHFVSHVSAAGSSTDEEEEANYPGGREGAEASAEGRGAEEDGMEERKWRALNLLSKLRVDAPRPADSSCLSNFEDCELIIC